jgi:hypothetical protein
MKTNSYLESIAAAVFAVITGLKLVIIGLVIIVTVVAVMSAMMALLTRAVVAAIAVFLGTFIAYFATLVVP